MVRSSTPLPLQLDWRNYSSSSYVTPVKEQGSCSACWAFAPTAALESSILISRNTPGIDLDLSEQTLISCGLSGSCDGGLIDFASDFIRLRGLPGESCYTYEAVDGLCANTCPDRQEGSYKITGWNKINPTAESIKDALYNYGPLVTLMAVHTDFFYYQSGIYSYSWGAFEGYHSALIVGYDEAEQYFIVKTSWGTDWGEADYSRIAYSEINSETQFGFFTIAYETMFPAGFPTISGVSRDAGTQSDKNNENDSTNTPYGSEENKEKSTYATGSTDNAQTTGSDRLRGGKSDPVAIASSFLIGFVKDKAGKALQERCH